MTFITPQQHINTTPRESRLEETVEVLKYCLVAVAVIGALIAADRTYQAMHEHNRARLEVGL